MPKKKTGKRPKQQEPTAKRTKPDAETTAAAPAAPAPAASSEDSSDETTLAPAATKAPTKAATLATEALAATAPSEAVKAKSPRMCSEERPPEEQPSKMPRKAEEPFDWQGPELTPAQLAQVKAAFSSMRKMEEESQCFQLFPVDRELPAEILARTAVWNWVQKGGEKPTFLFTAQMFGSGKSFFCENFTRILLQDLARSGPIYKSLTGQELLPADGRCNLQSMRSSALSIKSIVDIACARTIVISLNKDVPEFPSDFPLRKALYHAIFKKATNEEYPFAVLSPSDLFRALKEKTGFDGVWFIAIDEIGELDHQDFLDKWSDTREKKSDSRRRLSSAKRIPEKSPYRNLVNAFLPFLEDQHFMVFFAGRSVEMCNYALHSGSQSVSSFFIFFLMLDTFLPEHIVEIIVKTPKLSHVIPIEDPAERAEQLLELAKSIHIKLNGVPRLIETLLKYFWWPDVQSRCATLESCVRELESAKVVIFKNKVAINYVTPEGPFRAFLHALLHMQLFGVPITMETKFSSEGVHFDAVQAALTLGLYLKQVSEDTFKVVAGEWLTELLPENTRARLVSGLLAQSQPMVASQGRLFEVLFCETLALRISFATNLSDVPLFGLSSLLDGAAKPSGAPQLVSVKSFFKSTAAQSAEGDSGAAPKSKHAKKKTAAKAASKKAATSASAAPMVVDGGSFEALESFKPHQWKEFLVYLVESGKIGKVLLPDHANSHGPDVLFVITDSDGRITHVVMFALKNMQSTSKSSTKEVQEEVQKCLVEPHAALSRSGAKVPKLVLFFVSTQLDANIEKTLKQRGSSAFGAGAHGWKSVRGEETTTALFDIPQGCELIIPLIEAVDQFMGARQLDRLRKFFSKVGNQPADFHNIATIAVEDEPEANAEAKHAAAPGSFDGAATSHAAAQAPAAPAVERHPLFQNPKQPINIEWMRAVNEQVFLDDTITEEELQTWTSALRNQRVSTVGGLTKLSSASVIKDCGIPMLIADELYLQCHPEKR